MSMRASRRVISACVAAVKPWENGATSAPRKPSIKPSIGSGMAATPLAFVGRQPPFGAGSDPSNIVDSRYPDGSVQVPGGTEPVILHRDPVSGGGYFMIGTIISADMDAIGQMQPHARIRFSAVSMEAALAARHDRQAALEQLRDCLHSP